MEHLYSICYVQDIYKGVLWRYKRKGKSDYTRDRRASEAELQIGVQLERIRLCPRIPRPRTATELLDPPGNKRGSGEYVIAR